MSSAGSVTHWIGKLREGDAAAAQQLWERYFQQMVRLAHKKLYHRPRRAADEEDAALSAFASFCKGNEAGRFPQLADRDDLWRLLVVLTARKAARQDQRERRQKRGGGRVQDEAALGEGADEAGLAGVIGPEPTPAFAAQVAEELGRRFDLLDEELRAVALAKMEGCTNEEIAGQLDCAPRTVERKLQRIRLLWNRDVTP